MGAASQALRSSRFCGGASGFLNRVRPFDPARGHAESGTSPLSVCRRHLPPPSQNQAIVVPQAVFETACRTRAPEGWSIGRKDARAAQEGFGWIPDLGRVAP